KIETVAQLSTTHG
ncbi:unnamed protein product, partial [Allacma fusca]